MRKKMTALALVVMIGAGTAALAFEGRHGDRGDCMKKKQELISQLPEEKEMLFHKTMRDVREKSKAIREQAEKLRHEAREILTAPEFNEKLFQAKTDEAKKLHQEGREVMVQAISNLAKGFNQEERKILAELMQKGHRRCGHGPGH